MTRTITIDADTSISYIFPEKVFQIVNKETSTTRTTAQNAKNVLDIVAPSNTYTPQDLIDTLVTPMETVNRLSYTWSTTGEYIQTIQFNDYVNYPLTLDLTTNKLYIMNSNIIYDLTLNESSSTRASYLQAFYSDTLGLMITLNDLIKIYDLLYSFYQPTVYNTIASRQYDATGNRLPLSYTNQIKLSNHSNTSKATYTLTMNPNNTYNYTELAKILQLQENVITLASEPTETINVGQTLTLYNTNTIVNNTTYSADGNYVVESVEDTIIKVNENFPTPYLYTPPTINIVAYKSLIEKIERDTNTITLDNQADLSQFLIGDTITIKGTVINTEYENTTNNNELTLDGTYTIQDIQSHKIITEEQPLTDYEYTTAMGTQPYLYKKILIQNISAIDSDKTKVTLEAPSLIGTLTNSDPVVVIYQDNTESYSTISSINEDKIEIILTTAVSKSFTNNSGILQKRTPSPEVLIEITDSKNSTLMPNTTFMVDSKAQANSYLNLLTGLKTPDLEPPVTLSVPINACYNYSNEQVEETYYINTSTVEYMNLLGLYSEVYKDQTT